MCNSTDEKRLKDITNIKHNFRFNAYKYMQEFYKVSIYQRLVVNRHLVFKWETIYLYRDLIKSYRSLLD